MKIENCERIKNLAVESGCEVPDPTLVDAALSLSRVLQPADRVIASVNGTIYFEYYLPDGYLEIEVTSQHDAEFRYVEKPDPNL
jgi:hypothetical protein